MSSISMWNTFDRLSSDIPSINNSLEAWHNAFQKTVDCHAIQTKCDQSRKYNILYSFYKTHCDTRSVGPLLTAFVVPQSTRVTIKRIIVYYVLYSLFNKLIHL
jgi:hypothetical protein